jgi:alpha-D-ribose 1-methylphosphonate 5-triphosphate synthase subunit PhnL
MNHLSVRDDCCIKLSAQESKKRTNIVNHEYIQYLVIYPRKIMVRHIDELIHIIALKIKTGWGKINWKRLSTNNVADKTG